MKISESYAQPALSMGHQACKGAFGVHDRLFIKKPEQLLAGFICKEGQRCL
jgi:hypothetical protein